MSANSRIERIVELIDALVGNNFTNPKKKFWGLCTIESKDDKNIPVRYKGAGDFEDASFDDKYSLSIYHRITSDNDLRDASQGFGLNLRVSQIYTMRMVVFADMRNFSGDANDLRYTLKDDIAAIIPSGLTNAQLTTLQAQSCVISITSKDLDKRSVFNEEMAGAEYALAPNHVLFAINYTIQLEFLESCRGTNTSCDNIPALPIAENNGTQNFCDAVMNCVEEQGCDEVIDCLRNNAEFCELVNECVIIPEVNDASATVKGITKLSVPPASATNPIAVGDNDPRNSNARTPTAHASTHTNGTDDIQNATRTQKGILTSDDFNQFMNTRNLFLTRIMH